MSNIILCVDDSKIMQTVAEITFRVSDYTYVGAMSADEALQKAREQKPALILADAIMPGKTGYELCKALKSDPQLADVPVYLMCGNSAVYDAAKGTQARADGHLSKPWDTQVMLDKVAEILEKSPSRGAGQAAAQAPKVPVPPAAVTPVRATPPVKPAQTAPRVPMPPSPVKAPVKAPAPPVTPKPPLLPATPAAIRPATPAATKPATARPVDTQQAVTAARTHTIMGMPTVMPPKTPAEPAADARQSAPNLRSTAPGVTPLAPVTPAPPVTPAAPVASRPAPAVPGQKVASIQPAVSEPPPVKPVAPAIAPPLGATPAAARSGINRPPMIKGKPTKRPAFLAQMAASPPAASARIAAATSAAVVTAARESGLDPSGPEMRALLALSKDVVERVVWEVVPELAETIIRENLDRLVAARR